MLVTENQWISRSVFPVNRRLFYDDGAFAAKKKRAKHQQPCTQKWILRLNAEAGLSNRLMEPVIDFIHRCDTYKNTHLKIKIGFLEWRGICFFDAETEIKRWLAWDAFRFPSWNHRLQFSRILLSLATFHPRFPHFTRSINKYPAAFHGDIFMRIGHRLWFCLLMLCLTRSPSCPFLQVIKHGLREPGEG